MQNDQDSGGYAVIIVIATMIPLLVAVAAFSMLMNNRTSELRTERNEELALLAAESGVDHAMFKGRTGTLVHDGKYQINLGANQSFSVEPTHLKVDGIDNDGDGSIDEADEDVFQVVVEGTYRTTTRRLAAYLGPVPLLPTISSAMSTQDTGIAVDLKGTPALTGNDTNMDGSPGPGPSVAGLSIASPGTIAHLMSELTPSEQSQITGAGGTPSLAVAPAIDLPTIVAQLTNIASLVLTNDKYASFNFGDGPAGTAQITLRDGDLELAGNSQGAGILVVTGDLNLKGNVRFDGVIIVLGKLENSAGTASVYGSVLQGASGGDLETKGTLDLYYSTQAIDLANSLSGRHVSFNGWQELSRN